MQGKWEDAVEDEVDACQVALGAVDAMVVTVAGEVVEMAVDTTADEATVVAEEEVVEEDVEAITIKGDLGAALRDGAMVEPSVVAARLSITLLAHVLVLYTPQVVIFN